MSLKPDWSSAPEWANYLTMDDDGGFCWWEYEPVKGHHNWFCARGQLEPIPLPEMSIEKRPETMTCSSIDTVIAEYKP